MDIVKHITQHTEHLQSGLVKASVDQLKQLKIVTLEFYFQLPEALSVIEKYMQGPIDKDKLIDDIIGERTRGYKDRMEKSTAELDEYADDYEELEQIPIYILNAFDHAVNDKPSSEEVVALFLDIINTLDYYENFSDDPDYWNLLLEKEVEFQKEILATLESGDKLDTLVYQARYADVKFVGL